MLLAALVAACMLVLGACGGSKKSSRGGGSSAAGSAHGKQLFKVNCGGCHTLKDAATSGSVGPNLDELHPDKATVQAQVKSGGGGMPSFQGTLKPKDIDAVATYVSGVAGSK